MRKSYITLIFIILCSSLFFACDLTGIFNKTDSTEYSEKTNNNDNEEIKFTKVDFFEEYGLIIEYAGIWNDYMPGGWGLTPDGKRASICTIHISSPAGLPPMEVSANISTGSLQFDNVTFIEQYKDEQFGMRYPGRYWNDYRPDIGFRVEDYDRYIMAIIIKINGKQQVITVGDKVGVTH